ncbi:oligosaccharide flippase family protein [Roseibium album]|uniref:Teichuronic acid biosynthesis protein TuaB n=1 Tax=Roseibium album TaxID=311410 RepID=A0A0M6ZFP4_9HYPH|nr:oligosaccharide flippase family protein [Roseibium album]CTQ60233.1 Teichuronic acid biosynthesis protein TuaB [Roseibium album]CTQ66821.1 Teichuronic acid biosynthesis protein TuaB [Roseibium album]CTQ74584.1 Teichuronic acid biosynthesis protein TuaB [Roseibium album]
MLKQALSLSASNGLIALVNLFRNILIARLISVEDFGIASTFAVTMSLIEMTSNFALDRMLVQTSDGGSNRFQSSVQMLQAARGAIGAAIMFLAAGPIAVLFGVPDVAWAYQLLALVPLLRGLAHFDMFRLQRKLEFRTIICVEMGAVFLATASAFPLSIWLQDYRAMLWVLLLQQSTYTILSHVLAKRRYRWSFDSIVAKRAFVFGWPLLLNGILMFTIFQGDRVLVGSMIGMKELGWFSAALTLAIAPTVVIGKTLDSFFLPQLSRVQSKPEEFGHLYLASTQAALFAGVLLTLLAVLLGEFLVHILYGAKYGPAVPLLVLLFIAQGLRIGKAGPAIAATAKADTKNPMIANACRFLALPVAWLALTQGGGIMTIIYVAIAGEALALVVSLLMLHKRQNLPLKPLSIPLAISALAYGVAASNSLIVTENSIEAWAAQAALTVVLIAALMWSMRDLRAWVQHMLSLHRSGGGKATNQTH